MIGSHFNFYDLSQIQEVETPEVYDNSPVIISCFGADKGTEDMVALSGKDFISMYGEPNFKNYGQNSVQTRRANWIVLTIVTITNVLLVQGVFRIVGLHMSTKESMKHESTRTYL